MEEKGNADSGIVVCVYVCVNPVKHSVVCQTSNRAVMTGLVTQWLLIAAQQRSDSSVC